MKKKNVYEYELVFNYERIIWPPNLYISGPKNALEWTKEYEQLVSFTARLNISREFIKMIWIIHLILLI